MDTTKMPKAWKTQGNMEEDRRKGEGKS